MSGIKNIKKKLKGFQVRPPNIATVRFVAGSGVEARLQVERIHRRITRLRWMLLIHLCQWEPMSL